MPKTKRTDEEKTEALEAVRRKISTTKDRILSKYLDRETDHGELLSMLQAHIQDAGAFGESPLRVEAATRAYLIATHLFMAPATKKKVA